MDFTFQLCHGKVENKQKEFVPDSPSDTTMGFFILMAHLATVFCKSHLLHNSPQAICPQHFSQKDLAMRKANQGCPPCSAPGNSTLIGESRPQRDEGGVWREGLQSNAGASRLSAGSGQRPAQPRP